MKKYTIEIKDEMITGKGHGISIQEAFGLMTRIIIESSLERVLMDEGFKFTKKTKAKKAK